jgi:hypothetical protein
MKKGPIVFSIVVLMLIACGLTFGDNKPNVPAAAKTRSQSVPANMKPLFVDIAIDDIFTDNGCHLWVRWINKGTVKIDKVLRETVYAYGTSIQSDSANHVVLEPGAVFAHAVGSGEGVTVPAAVTVVATIDANGVLNEANSRKGNNSMAKTVTCGKARPDLMPTYIDCHALQSYTDAQGHGCKVFEVSVTIKNFGNKDVTTPFKVYLERDSGANLSYVPFRTFDVPGLAAGASLVLEPKPQSDTCFWYLHNPNLPHVSPRIRVTVDSGGAVSESLEDNNQTVHSCGGM